MPPRRGDPSIRLTASRGASSHAGAPYRVKLEFVDWELSTLIHGLDIVLTAHKSRKQKAYRRFVMGLKKRLSLALKEAIEEGTKLKYSPSA